MDAEPRSPAARRSRCSPRPLTAAVSRTESYLTFEVIGEIIVEFAVASRWAFSDVVSD